MNDMKELKTSLEAVLLVATDPVPLSRLAAVADSPESQVARALAELTEEFETREGAIRLRHVGGGYRLYAREECAPIAERYLAMSQGRRLSRAAIETLAVIAYRQPASRREIGDIRGVGVEGVLASLEDKGLIREVGREEGPGAAILYGTTRHFLEKLGINSLAELPPLETFEPASPSPSGSGPG